VKPSSVLVELCSTRVSLLFAEDPHESKPTQTNHQSINEPNSQSPSSIIENSTTEDDGTSETSSDGDYIVESDDSKEVEEIKKYEAQPNQQPQPHQPQLHLHDVQPQDAGSGMFQYLLTSMYSSVSDQLKILPGSEFRAAYSEAKELGCPVVLGDRPVGITIARTWGSLSVLEKLTFIFYLFMSFSFEIKAEDIERMKSSDLLTEMIKEMTDDFPSLITPLLYERDQYLAATLKMCPGPRVVGVVGLGHVEGIKKNWENKINPEILLEVVEEPRWKKITFRTLLIVIPLLFLISLYLGYKYLPIPFPLFMFLFFSIWLIFKEVVGLRTSDLLDQLENDAKDKRKETKNQ